MLQSLPPEARGFKGTRYDEMEPKQLYFIITLCCIIKITIWFPHLKFISVNVISH